MLRLSTGWVLVALLLAPATALAQGGDELARAHFASGSAYYEEGRYEDAAREFLEAYRLSPRAELLENAARAQERALLYDDAIATLERLLSTHPDYAQAETIRERLRNYRRLRDRLASQRGGGEPAEQEPTEPAEVQASSGTTSGSGAPGDGGGGGISIPGVILLAGGGALGIAALATGIGSQVIYDGLQTDCMMSACPADRQGDVDTGEALALTSTILMFPSIVAIGVGIVLLIVDSGGGGDEEAALEVVPGPGLAGLAVRGRL